MAGLWGPTDSFDGKGFFSGVGGAVNDLFSAMGRAAEAKNYGLAANLARENADYVAESTAIKKSQAQRESYKVLGGIESSVAGSGFEMGGSGLDILRDSANQAQLTQDVLTKQGKIQQDAFEVQAQSYDNMAKAAKKGILGSEIAAGLKLVGAGMAL